VFNLGPEKILLILLIALVVLGPHELPDAARKIGNVVGELRRMSAGFEQELRSSFDGLARDPSPDATPSPAVDSSSGPSTARSESDPVA
jgi:Tat protein translocase TatB subunit